MLAAFKALSLLARVGLILAAVLSLWGGLQAWKWNLRREGKIAVLQELSDRTRVERDRRLAELSLARAEADRVAADLSAAQDRNNALTEEINRASAANLSACLDVAAAGRLSRIGRSQATARRGASDRAPLPVRRPAF